MLKPQSVIVIDDFYDNPIEIREHALSLDYKQKDGATGGYIRTELGVS
ncbi:hypothetical protein KKJ06_10845 [Xenorhabdus bovienii]|nr:hypothetical protein [Xenorhabdus bovienii]MDE9452506.1 hypothetical protein [Xenorhabdus bovienii]MDE9553132.1 hypothetical protein [Xenorhabdus bovienii]MDE9555917.1 hypothetical protein [Xenorhabdus bovienii]MDE9563715.1 hypothetical protein [Xenorhabdus bovienii]